MENYNIASLFDIAFGIKSIGAYIVPSTDEKPKNINFDYSGVKFVDDKEGNVKFDYTGVQVTESLDYATKLSHLGTPMIVPILFKGKRYQVFNDFGDVVLDRYEDFYLPATSLVSLRRAKIISKTKASAASGTVKELFGFDDWVIDIRGFCLADPAHANAKTAREQKIKIAEFEKIVDSIDVVSEIFIDFNIEKLVIEEIQFDQLKGRPGVIPFYMRCTSDEPSDRFY